MKLAQWAYSYDSPPSLTACGHTNHSNTDPRVQSGGRLLLRQGESVCLDCGHRWQEYPITISDLEYDTLLAFEAYRLDNK